LPAPNTKLTGVRALSHVRLSDLLGNPTIRSKGEHSRDIGRSIGTFREIGDNALNEPMKNSYMTGTSPKTYIYQRTGWLAVMPAADAN